MPFDHFTADSQAMSNIRRIDPVHLAQDKHFPTTGRQLIDRFQQQLQTLARDELSFSARSAAFDIIG